RPTPPTSSSKRSVSSFIYTDYTLTRVHQVFDADIRNLLIMSDMWRARAQPVPLDFDAILDESFVLRAASGSFFPPFRSSARSVRTGRTSAPPLSAGSLRVHVTVWICIRLRTFRSSPSASSISDGLVTSQSGAGAMSAGAMSAPPRGMLRRRSILRCLDRRATAGCRRSFDRPELLCSQPVALKNPLAPPGTSPRCLIVLCSLPCRGQ
ncbi:hypothetical protein C8R47DRAFT_1290930, partial [Mycena vitilis]